MVRDGQGHRQRNLDRGGAEPLSRPVCLDGRELKQHPDRMGPELRRGPCKVLEEVQGYQGEELPA